MRGSLVNTLGAFLFALSTGCAGPPAAGPDASTAPPSAHAQTGIRIGITSVPVSDQARALRFYTEKLGFEKKEDVPVGAFRWLTVVSPAGAPGVELLLEPNAHPATKAFQEALYADGIPAAMFFVDDVEQTYERLRALGVRFQSPPAIAGGAMVAVFDDTCGNWISLAEVLAED